MSGVDEQIRDIPICPVCGEKPDFWILYPNMERTGVNGWYWLHSDKYLDENSSCTKLMRETSFSGMCTTLKEIVCVTCRPKRYRKHVFTSEHLTFQEVLQHARRLEK